MFFSLPLPCIVWILILIICFLVDVYLTIFHCSIHRIENGGWESKEIRNLHDICASIYLFGTLILGMILLWKYQN